MRLITLGTLAMLLSVTPQGLHGQAACGRSDTRQLATATFARLVGAARVDSARRTAAVALIEQAIVDVQAMPAAPGASADAPAQQRIRRLYAELRDLLRPDVDLSHLTRDATRPRYLYTYVPC